MKFIVASTNPVKINAVKSVVASKFPNVKVLGLAVDSGVSAQPMNDEETKLGSINRARAVRDLALEQKTIEADEEFLCLGLEGGVFQPNFAKNPQELWSTVWVSALDQHGQEYYSNGGRFPLPEFLAKMILSGQEMGPALGDHLHDPDLRKKQGMIGVVTRGFTDRTSEYATIARLCIGLWYGQLSQTSA